MAGPARKGALYKKSKKKKKQGENRMFWGEKKEKFQRLVVRKIRRFHMISDGEGEGKEKNKGTEKKEVRHAEGKEKKMACNSRRRICRWPDRAKAFQPWGGKKKEKEKLDRPYTERKHPYYLERYSNL